MSSLEEPERLHPDYIYREPVVQRVSGLRHTQLNAKIAAGEFPAPVKLSDTGRARGWFGRDLIRWQGEREAAREAVQRPADQRESFSASPPDNRTNRRARKGAVAEAG